MKFQQKIIGFEDKIIKDSSKNNWEYISEAKMREMYPDNGYKILADLRKTDDESTGELTYCLKSTPIYNYRDRLEHNQKCLGFICVETEDNDNSFIRIIGRKKNKGSYYFLFILLMFLFAGLVFLLQDNKEDINLDKHAISYHYEGLKNTDPSKISIPVFGVFEIDVDNQKVNYSLVNPEGNPCYFKYSIILLDKEKEEELYESELIKPGTGIPDFEFKRKLTVGEYDAIIRVKTYELKNPDNEMNGGEINIKIIVKDGE